MNHQATSQKQNIKIGKKPSNSLFDISVISFKPQKKSIVWANINIHCLSVKDVFQDIINMINMKYLTKFHVGFFDSLFYSTWYGFLVYVCLVFF